MGLPDKPCYVCGKWDGSIYSSDIVLKAGHDLGGRQYHLCCDCATRLRDYLDPNKAYVQGKVPRLEGESE